jgi:hypothetical protein
MKKFKIKGKFDVDKNLGVTFEEFEKSLKEERLKESLKFKYLYGEINPHLEGRNMEGLLTILSNDFIIHKVNTNKKDESFEIVVVAASIYAFDMINTAYQSANHEIYSSIRSIVDPKEKTIQTVTFDLIIKKLEKPDMDRQLEILTEQVNEISDKLKENDKIIKDLESKNKKLKELLKTEQGEINRLEKLIKENKKLEEKILNDLHE